MKSIFTLLLFVCCLGFSALTQKLNYDNNYNWYLGFNTGAAWQTTDVDNKTKLGWGFTLGKSFLMDYGRPISFDIRARYLRGYWEGIDSETTNGNTGNTTVDSIYGGGPIKRNFLSEQHRIALELVLHANNFRERTGWDPYIFLGIGITGHNAFGDYITYDDNGTFLEQAYDFSSNENTDRVYEFAMANSENTLYNDEKLQWNFMPSLGFGLGYFITPYITAGLEHKTTFTLDDYYDGYAAGSGNDIYHYTNGYIRFYLGAKKKDLASNRPEPPLTPEPITSNPRPVDPEISNPIRDPKPPIVNYTQPSVSPYTTQNSTYNLKASILHVNNPENIIFRQNGIVKTDFVFNANTHAFSSQVSLTPGQNIFVIIASNSDGDDTETMIINYERETQVPPVVTITRPASNPDNVNTNNYNFMATVLNVAGKNNIELLLNGSPISNFNYTTSTSGLSHTLTLLPGANTVKVTGTNTAGSDTESTMILYRPGNTVQPPVVNFTNPSANPFTLNTPSFSLTASVLNINNREQLTFKQNGVINSNFNFNTTNFSSNVVLIPGQNVFELIGTNSAGTDHTTTIIIYNRPAPKPPIVTISKPFNNPFTTSNNTTVINATLLNITNSNQINMTLNGNTFNNFNFSTQNSTLIANVNLQIGNNVVNITGTNNDGTDSKQTIIIYTPIQTLQPPVVDFTRPNTNPFNTTSAVEIVNANVFNITTKNQINVLLNGQNISNFTFNSTSHVIGLNANLVQGANLITITATNSAGVASETQTIIRSNPEPQNPPVVTFLDPISNPVTVFSNNYSIAAKVQNVLSKQNILLKINGVATNNFSYSTSNNEMNFSTGLVNGANIIEITGTNIYGQDIASTTIIYKRQNVTLPPSVNITTPVSTSSISNQQSYLIEAEILNVTNANQINMTVNGTTVGGFVFNSNSHILNFNGNLNTGLNTIIIHATNIAGTATDNAFITFRPQEIIEAPIVSFIKPVSSGSSVNSPGYMVEAKVLHVNTKSGVTLKFNGQTINPAYYSFNTSTKIVKYASTLTLGNNIFEITGTNSAGTQSASTVLNYSIPIEEPCDAPMGTIVSPVSNGSVTENELITFKANVQHVDNMSQISLKVNGSSKSFSLNSALTQITRSIRLTEGNNTIEVILETPCGKKRLTRSITYKKAEEPCNSPLINPVSPNLSFNTELNNASIVAIFTNIERAEQITLLVNGKKETFIYEEAQHTLTANPELVLGLNKVILSASTDCGSKEVIWTINRKPCNKPVIRVVGKPSNTGLVNNPDFSIVGSISNLGKRETVTTTQNGKAINFVYSNTSESYATSTVLKEGLNTFIITANSACGKTIKSIKVTYKPIVQVKAPTVRITRPASNTISTEANTYLVTASTTNVTAANQIAVSVNGANVNFNFNPSTAIIRFNPALSVGQNNIVVTVVNPGGTASDNTTIIHTEPIQIAAPVINIATPSSNPHTTNRNGRVLVSGTINNISAANQVQILFNGTVYTGSTPTIANDVYTFNFYVPVSDAVPSTTVTIIANNIGGSDTENQTIQKQTTNTGVTSGGGTITIGGGGLGGGN